MTLRDKVFVVTGAGGGIGTALVANLLNRGAKVAAVDLREESLQQLKEANTQYDDALSTHAVNITDRGAAEALPDQVLQAHGAIDGVINCAGIIQPFIKVNDLDYDAIERVMNVNFYGTVYMTKSFLPRLLDRPEAYIVNFSSMGGFLPVPGQSIYGASKAAVKLLTEGLYAELRGTNVHVSVVFPGATKTNISQNSGVAAPSVDSAAAEKFPMLPAEDASELVISGMEHNKPQIFTGKDSNGMNMLYRVNPVYATNMIAKKMGSLLNR